MASDRTLKAKAYLSNPSFQTSGSLSTSLRGVGIASIAKTSTEGLVDTYTITYTDGRTQTYEVTNGAQGERGPRGDKGPRGYTGFSAYDYAVNGGYEGTEEEFTALMASNATMAETVEYYSWTEEIKAALLACLEKVAWTEPDGQTYYDALYAALYDRTWSVTNVLTGCRNTNTMSAITKGRPYNGILEALSAYTMDGATVSITMGGVDVTESVYTDGVISIPAVTGAVVITAEAVRTAWSVTNVLTNCTSDNLDDYAGYNEPYTAELTAVEGYEINTVTITMGGEDVSTYYSSGTISIPAVTGDVVITATAHPVISWDYSLGRLPSSDDGITTTENGITATFDASKGIVANNTSATSSQYVQFRPTAYSTAKKAAFEAVFTIVSATASSYGGLQTRLSNGTSGANVSFTNRSSGGLAVRNLEGSSNTSTVTIQSFSLNTEYKLRVEYESGVNTKIYINDQLVHTATVFSSYYTTANRLYLQGGQKTYVKSMKWIILEV